MPRLDPDTGLKECTRCGIRKAASDFSRDRSRIDGLSRRCKTCQVDIDAEWYGAHRERVAARNAAWRATHPGRKATADVARRYGCSEPASRCDMSDDSCRGPFCWDHDHACCPGEKSCGQCVRGQLCRHHNRLVGKYEAGHLVNAVLVSNCERYLQQAMSPAGDQS